MNEWKKSIEEVSLLLEKLDDEREKLLKITRELTRACREIVFKIHAGHVEEAGRLLGEVEKIHGEIMGYKARIPQLFYTGSVNNALTEYVEAKTLYSIITSGAIPPYHESLAPPSSYLAGLGDVIGELRRHALNLVREGKIADAWKTLNIMEEIFVEVSKLSFPEALIPGVRHKMDVARIIIENTRKDLLFYEKSGELVKKLEAALVAFKEMES